MVTEQEILEKYGKDYKDGEVMCKEGEEGKTMFIIQSGKVKITKQAGDIEKTLVILEPGEFFGEMSIIDKGKRSASAVAMGETKAIELDEELFEIHIQSNPKIVKKILKNLSARLREADKQIENLMVKDNNIRIANQLFILISKHGTKTDKGIKMDFPLTAKELANQAGIDEELTETIVKRLIKANVLKVDGNELIVTSEDNLEKFNKYLEMKREFGDSGS
jgi:CRP/FNR family cyclic AMP-dependent transcriptional regulator